MTFIKLTAQNTYITKTFGNYEVSFYTFSIIQSNVETECPSGIHGTALTVSNGNHSNLPFEFTMQVFIHVWKEENLFLDVVHTPLTASHVAEATL